MGVTKKFAKWAVETRYEQLPKDVVEKAKEFVLETVASELLGSTCKVGKSMARVLEDEAREATLIGTGRKASLRNAALYNTAIADTNDSGGGASVAVVHHSKNVVPAALTVASAKGKSGKDMITAIAVAHECYQRLDRAIAVGHLSRGHYNDGTVGTIGSTIAAGKLFGLDQDTMEGAIGNGGMFAPVTVGGNSMYRSAGRPLTMGLASANGVLAVEMALAGVHGPHDILECAGGFAQALSGTSITTEITEDLGKEWLLLGNYYKPFIGCRLTFVPRQGAQILMREHKIKAEDIEKVTCKLPSASFMVMSHYADVGANIVEHSCSGPYLLANILMYGDVGSACLSEERMMDPKVHEFMRRIELVPDPEIDRVVETKGMDGLWWGSIDIITKAGKTYNYSSDHMRGDPVRWPMTREELKDKLREFASGILSKEQREKVIETTLSLEKLDNVATLMDMLAGR